MIFKERSSTGFNSHMIIKSGGNIGIGTTNPTEKFQVNDNSSKLCMGSPFLNEISSYMGFNLNYNTDNSYWEKNANYGANGIIHTHTGRMKFVAIPASAGTVSNDEIYNNYSIMTLYHEAGGNNGRVVYGSDQLDVNVYINGIAKANEVEIALTEWSDFVFDKEYDLRSLTEVETFINANNHLPDVPSEKEVIENGLYLGEMNAILLQKIEELTLYIIEQDKEIQKIKLQLEDH